MQHTRLAGHRVGASSASSSTRQNTHGPKPCPLCVEFRRRRGSRTHMPRGLSSGGLPVAVRRRYVTDHPSQMLLVEIVRTQSRSSFSQSHKLHSFDHQPTSYRLSERMQCCPFSKRDLHLHQAKAQCARWTTHLHHQSHLHSDDTCPHRASEVNERGSSFEVAQRRCPKRSSTASGIGFLDRMASIASTSERFCS